MQGLPAIALWNLSPAIGRHVTPADGGFASLFPHRRQPQQPAHHTLDFPKGASLVQTAGLTDPKSWGGKKPTSWNHWS